MKLAAISSLMLFILSSATSAANLQCDIGPVTKDFAGGPWLVYACSDGHSLALISPRESRAFPFVFSLIFVVAEQRYEIHGEGTGDKAASDAVARELQALKQSDLDQLLSEARAAKH